MTCWPKLFQSQESSNRRMSLPKRWLTLRIGESRRSGGGCEDCGVQCPLKTLRGSFFILHFGQFFELFLSNSFFADRMEHVADLKNQFEWEFDKAMSIQDDHAVGTEVT
jgi:hypothetical protein